MKTPPKLSSQYLAAANRARISTEKQFNDLYVDSLLSMDMMRVPPRSVTNKQPSNYYVVVQTGRSVITVDQGKSAIIIFNPHNQRASYSPAPISADVFNSSTLMTSIAQAPTIDTGAEYYPADLSQVFGYAQPDVDGTFDYCPLKGRMVIDCIQGNSVGAMSTITAVGLADVDLQCGYLGAPVPFNLGNWYDATVGTYVVPNLAGSLGPSVSVENHATGLVPAKNARAGVLLFQPLLDRSLGDTFRTGCDQTQWGLLGADGYYPNHLGYGTSKSCVQPHFVVTNNSGAGDALKVYVTTTVAYAVPATPQQGRSFPLYIHAERTEFRKAYSAILRCSLSGVGSVAFESSKSLQDAVLATLLTERKSAPAEVSAAARRHGQAEAKQHHEATSQRVRATESAGKAVSPNPAVDSSAFRTVIEQVQSLYDVIKPYAAGRTIEALAGTGPLLLARARGAARPAIQPS